MKKSFGQKTFLKITNGTNSGFTCQTEVILAMI